MNTRYRKDAGDQGEDFALHHLEHAGLTLITRNYRTVGGEIDLVMLEQNTLVFVEVRFRNNRKFGGALASVTAQKQQRLLLAAQRFLQSHREYQSLRARFDVVSLEGELHTPSVEWIKAAFTA